MSAYDTWNDGHHCFICGANSGTLQLCVPHFDVWIGSTYQKRSLAAKNANWANTIFFDWINLKRLENLNGSR